MNINPVGAAGVTRAYTTQDTDGARIKQRPSIRATFSRDRVSISQEAIARAREIAKPPAAEPQPESQIQRGPVTVTLAQGQTASEVFMSIAASALAPARTEHQPAPTASRAQPERSGETPSDQEPDTARENASAVSAGPVTITAPRLTYSNPKTQNQPNL